MYAYTMKELFASCARMKLARDAPGFFSFFWVIVPLIIDLGETFVCLQVVQTLYFGSSTGLGSAMALGLMQGTNV